MTTRKIGYGRVSTVDQDLTIQKEALKKSGCTQVLLEKVSGTSLKGRDKLQIALDALLDGDTLVVTRIDRLARSLRDLQNILHDIESKGAHLEITEQSINTSTSSGKAFLGMLGIFAEFETNIRKERQLEGIAKAKLAGKFKGRKPTARAKTEQVLELLAKGMTRQAVANELGIGVASVYRILKAS